MPTPLRFSIIIPVKPGGHVVALQALRALDYPLADYEVIIAEGTRPSVQRNLAVQAAQGDLLYFLDDDSLVAVASLKRIAGAMQDRDVAAIGGPSLTPASDTAFQRVIGYAVQSPLGSGGVRNRYRQTGSRRVTNDRELILCNLCFRRELFLAAGGLDERLYPNEENELLDRMRTAGQTLVHDPELAIYRSQRSSVWAFCRQMYGYGRGRGEQSRIARQWQLGPLLPSLFLCYIVTLLFFHAWWYLLPLIAYLVLIGITALQASWSQSVAAIGPRLCLIIPAIHLLYGVGILAGLLRPRFAAGVACQVPVAIRYAKEFGQPWGQGRGVHD